MLLLSCASEHARYPSPDGRFVVVSHTGAFSGLLPVAPGQGSDTPGRVEVVRLSDQRSCGSAKIPMVWMAADVRFYEESASLPGAATWDLGACTVDTSGW